MLIVVVIVVVVVVVTTTDPAPLDYIVKYVCYNSSK